MLLTGGAQEGQTEALKIQPTREKQNNQGEGNVEPE